METFEDMDIAHDGRITFDEYINHITGYADEKHNDSEWLEKEKDYFEQTLDIDKNGSLNKTEVEKWIRPEGSNPIEFEVQHMVQRLDMNTGIVMKFFYRTTLQKGLNRPEAQGESVIFPSIFLRTYYPYQIDFRLV